MIVLLPALPFSVQAEELIAPLSLASSQTGEISDDGVLRIEADPNEALRALIRIEGPGASEPVYALKALVRYENVGGNGFLQLDNHFDGRGVFFTRSVAAEGPLRSIADSSDWRPFTLPFYANTGDRDEDSPLTPDRLTLSLYLPQTGTVYLRDLALYQYARGEDPMASQGQWFDTRSAGILGAVGGTAVGLWGALIGVLDWRGRARGFVVGSTTVLLVLGSVSLAAGIPALALGQPYAVYYTLMLFGLIVAIVAGSLPRTLPRRYESLELQRMRAMDA